MGESVSNVLVGFGTLLTEQKLSKTWVWAALGWPTWVQLGTLNPPKSHLGGVLGRLAGVLRRLGCVFRRHGASWSLLEPSRAHLGASSGRLGGILGRVLGRLRASWGVLARFGGVWGPIFEAK